MGRAISGTVVAITLAITFASCGGEEEPSEPKRPTLAPELAAAFASDSDQIAASLAAGDGCAAHIQAQELRAQIGDAVGSGQVHPALGREMSAAATSLSDGIQCEPAPQPAPQPKPAPAPTGCEQIVAQLSQLRTQWEQAEAQEEEAHGQEKKAFKDLKKQLEDQAVPLIEQFRDQCDEDELPDELSGLIPDGGGGGPPGLDGGSPGNSDHGGGGGGRGDGD